jgi:LemA protein
MLLLCSISVSVQLNQDVSIMQAKKLLTWILVFILSVIVGWLVFLLIFAIFTSTDGAALSDFYDRLAFLLSFVLAIVITISYMLISSFNKIKKIKNIADSSYSSISIYKKKATDLLDKANRVIDKYIRHESEVHTQTAQYRSESMQNKPLLPKRINTSAEFLSVVENYPDLKAIAGVQQLIGQIVETETSITNSKITYNNNVTAYNSFISGFPVNLMKNKWNLEPLAFYSDDSNSNVEITDELLGI